VSINSAPAKNREIRERQGKACLDRDVLTLGIMALGKVVSGTALAVDERVWTEETTEPATSHLGRNI
jgi:hypothetical protein